MKKGKVGFENGGLIILLSVLGVMIVGLIVGIVMVNMRKNDEVVVENEDDEENLANEYVSYVENYEAVREKAQELLRQDPVDVNAIVALYSDNIEYNIANGAYDRVSSYMLAEMDDLVSGGFQREALNILISMDFSIFDEPEQYRWYSEIIVLAEELNDTEVMRVYEPLRESVREAYEINYAASEAAAKEDDLTVIDSDKEEEEEL